VTEQLDVDLRESMWHLDVDLIQGSGSQIENMTAPTVATSGTPAGRSAGCRLPVQIFLGSRP
jgi:hypothetical protein